MVAVSSTGWGEAYLLNSAAAQVGWFIKHLNLTPAQAVNRVMRDVLPEAAGGMIAVGPGGEVALDFTTGSLNRGIATSDGRSEVAVRRD